MGLSNNYLMNMMKMHASSQAHSYSFVRLGHIKDYDAETNSVKVGFFNATTGEYDLMSGWLQHVVPTAGKGDDSEAGEGDSWGFQHIPNMEQQVIVLAHNGDFTNGFVLGATYNDKVPPPTVDDALTDMGEFLWCHKTGSYFKFWNDGSITIYATGDLNLHADGNMNVHVLGDLQFAVDGAVTISAGKGMVLKAASQITLDAPAVNTSGNVNVGTGATGTFPVDNNIITVMNGIITNIE